MHPRHFPPTPQQRARGRAIFGTVVIVFGVLLLLQMLDLLPPIMWSVHFGWPLLLVLVGILIGIKSRFRNHAWWILILLGGVHLIPPFTINGVPSRRVIWPSMLIAVGLLIVLRRNHHHKFRHRGDWQCPAPGEQDVVTTDQDYIDIDALFSGRKEIVTARNFRGGRVAANFSGVELNLVGADATAPMMLDLRITCASLELIVPTHWEVQNEVVPTMGSVDDERRVTVPSNTAEKRLLILRGTVTFGSVEIKSY